MLASDSKTNKEYFQANYQKTKEHVIARMKRYSRTPAGRFARAKTVAKYRKLDWLLTFEQFVELISKPCHYCGGQLNPTSTGLDRKNNAFGYTTENALPCCFECNSTKNSHLSYDEMVLVMKHRRGEL